MDRDQSGSRLTLAEWLKENGYRSREELVARLDISESVYPALCRDGCEVEPDGYCRHGAPSVLVALGFI